MTVSYIRCWGDGTWDVADFEVPPTLSRTREALLAFGEDMHADDEDLIYWGIYRTVPEIPEGEAWMEGVPV